MHAGDAPGVALAPALVTAMAPVFVAAIGSQLGWDGCQTGGSADVVRTATRQQRAYIGRHRLVGPGDT
jgi:hypothetical protein